MGARPRARQAFATERGFTLVELLVVVLIVAILAAIALPSFLDQKSKSQDVEAKWMAAVTAQALHVWHQDHDTYAGATPEALTRIEPAVRTARGLTLTDLTRDDFTISVDSAAGDTGGGPFLIEQRGPVTERSCIQPGRGACPDDGRW
jgi:prepilin-type N-terminal cleavage/methylation domain-containing protein